MTHDLGTKEQMKAFFALDIEGPIHMLNLLRYKKDGGRESYAKYSANTGPLIEQRGGKVVYRATGRAAIIGDEEWDTVLIVEYPSRDAFKDMIMSDEYQAGVHFRAEALEDSRLICMQTG